MKLNILYDRNGYYIGYSKENNLLCAWTDIKDPFTGESKHTILCQFNSKSKDALFSVELTDEFIDRSFSRELDKYLKKYGFK